MKCTYKATKNPYKYLMWENTAVKPDGPFLFRYKEDGNIIEIPCYIICGFENRKYLIHVPEFTFNDLSKYCEHFYICKESKDEGVFVFIGGGYFLN